MASQASAASCSLPLPGLSDSLGFNWDITSGSLDQGWSNELAGGWIDKGGFLAQDNDAYDGWGVLRIGASAPGGTLYPNPAADGCGREDGDREISFPPATVGGLEVSRKVYVPASGVGFVRFLDVIENPSNAGPDVTTTLSYEGDLGSDDNTKVLATSDGNNTISPPPAPLDRWATSVQDPLDPPPARQDPPLAHIWDGPGSPPSPASGVFGKSTGGTDPWGDGEARVRIVYDVTIPEGETLAFMHFEAQRSTSAGALAAAQAIGNVTTADGFAGLSEIELGQLRNWDPSDLDGDGAGNSADNCRLVSNSSQANLDGDGFGDACDGDIDGDGLSNATEAALGTNPNAADSDEDGRSDGADACPLTAGQGADGCPQPAGPGSAVPTSTPRDTSPPMLRLLVRRSVKRRTLIRGLTVIVRANEACSLKVELLAKSRSSRRRVRKFSLALGRESLPVSGAGTRALRLRPSRRVIRRAARSPVQVRVTAVDRAGNRTVATRAIRVR
jgi:hypothetical protein